MTAVAAIDCGTNTTRLLVRDRDAELVRDLRFTRLGQGVDSSGELNAEAIDRTLAALAEYAKVCRDLGVVATRCVATSAARDASNSSSLFAPAEKLLGVPLEIIDGSEEAALSFMGATTGLDPHPDPTLVLDIGGGSTEFAVGRTECEGAYSADVGSVRLSERYLQSDPPRPEELSAALSIVALHLEDVTREVPAVTEATRLVAVGGTATTVAAVEMGLLTHDPQVVHGFRLSKDAAEDVFRTLATENLEDRKHNPGLPPERADVIVGGCAILVGVMRQLGFEECVVSESDILDGLAGALLSSSA